MFMSRVKTFIVKHKIITAILVIALIGGGYYWYSVATTPPPQPTYTLAPVTQGTLITSVTGTGQVSATNQLDVKSQASGTVTYVGVTEGQQVKAGDTLVKLDDTSARQAVRNAEADLASAQLSYNKLTEPATQLSITQAQNSVSDAQQSLTQAQENLALYQQTSTQAVMTAYSNGYNSASNGFLDMPTEMSDLKNLRGTDIDADANVSAFKLILGDTSPLIVNWLNDHDAALASYTSSFTYFKTVPRTSDQTTQYSLISQTLDTENAVAQALQSASAMLDATVNTTYSQYSIAPTVNTYRQKILTDISQINNDIANLQQAKDTIDTNATQGPITLKQDQDAINTAQGNLDAATESLAQMKAGPDPIDVQTAKLAIQQKQNALSDAELTLSYDVVTAPFDGTVATITPNVGDQLSNGGDVATLVTADRFVNVTLNEVDAVKTAAGQKATITFDAISGLSIAGTVTSVDLLGTVTQGVVNYGVNIKLDTQDDRIRPGMSASANIVTQVEPDVLLVPGAAVKTQGNASYVQMFSDHQSANETTVTTAEVPRRQQVVTGDSNDTDIIIKNGLNLGDMIVVKTAAAGTATTTAAARPATGGLGGIPGLSGAGGGAARFGGGGASFGR
jgi:HlyD family secretion protein